MLSRRKASQVDILHVTTTHPADDTRIWFRQGVTAQDHGLSVGLVALEPLGDLPQATVVSVTNLASRFWRPLLGTLRTLKEFQRLNPRVVQFHDPELALAAILIRVLSKPTASIIFDLHEDLAYDLPRRSWCPTFLTGLVARLGRSLMRLCASVSEHVIVATPGIRSTLGEVRPTITVIRNFPRLPPARERQGVGTRTGVSVCMTGTLDDSRGLDIVHSAVQLGLPACIDSLHLVGSGDPVRMSAIASKDARVVIHGSLPSDQVLRIQESSTIGIAIYERAQSESAGLSTKLLEYLALGLVPIVSNYPHGLDVLDRLREPRLLANSGSSLVDALQEACELARSPVFLDKIVSEFELDRWEAQEELLIQAYSSTFRQNASSS